MDPASHHDEETGTGITPLQRLEQAVGTCQKCALAGGRYVGWRRAGL